MDIRIRCPGQDARSFDPEGVREYACPRCGRLVEFFPDDRSRKCPGCGARLRNPSLDLGCAEWCRYASECVDFAPSEGGESCAEGALEHAEGDIDAKKETGKRS